MKRRFILTALFALAFLILTACAPSSKEALKEFVKQNQSQIEGNIVNQADGTLSKAIVRAQGENVMVIRATFSASDSKLLTNKSEFLTDARKAIKGNESELKEAMQGPLKKMQKSGVQQPRIRVIYELKDGKVINSVDSTLKK